MACCRLEDPGIALCLMFPFVDVNEKARADNAAIEMGATDWPVNDAAANRKTPAQTG